MAPAILEEPCYKILLSQLRNSPPNIIQKPYNSWKVCINNTPRDMHHKSSTLAVSNCWIQGAILPSDFKDDSFLINDKTGVAKIVGFLKLPKQPRLLKPGDVVMVVGHVLLTNIDNNLSENGISLCAQIKAMKVTNLLRNADNLQDKKWIKDVQNAQAVILNCKELIK